MKQQTRFSLTAFAALLAAGTAGARQAAQAPPAVPAAAPARKPLNVLFIAVDDLRPTFGKAYNGPIKTPNIDKLAGRGTTFLQAYCQQAVCSPSRSSILTGQRPDTTGVYDLVTHFRKNLPDVVTLPQYFKQSGYDVQGMGKIYHSGYDDAPSWSVPHWEPKTPPYGPGGMEIRARHQSEGRGQSVGPATGPFGPAWESADVPDTYFTDGAVADHAISVIRESRAAPSASRPAGDAKPFFLAVGFAKPHLPFVAPKKYWDLYKPSDIKLPANYNKIPADAAPVALHTWNELRAYYGMPQKGPVTDEQAKNLIHGYYASASYMDAQVGRVLDELNKQGLTKNTVVVLWGDHGWSLGEHGLWCKHTNFEDSAHAPLIVSVPGQKRTNAKVRSLAEFVDVYPTLCEAVGLPVPPSLAGKSLLPVLSDPSAPTKPYAFSQYPRGGGSNSVMGYSLTDGRFRYTEWGVRGTELYDHQTDPGEDRNIARAPENKARIDILARALHAAYPKAARQAEAAEAASR